jgi:tripartite-type tricarboxylate transporter receptor subunit TctC
VTKDTPAEAREAIAAIAERTVMSDRAQALAAETGAQVYWLNAEESAAVIQADRATLGTTSKALGN